MNKFYLFEAYLKMSSLPSGWEKEYDYSGMILSELKDLEINQQKVLVKYTNRRTDVSIDVIAERTNEVDDFAVKKGVEYYVRINETGPLEYDYSPDNFDEAKKAALDEIDEIEEGMSEEEIDKAVKKAYNLGKKEAPDSTDGKGTPDEVYEGMKESLPQMSRWANTLEPKLRRMAGYKDSGGMGTYTEPGSDQAPYILDELVDAFWEGVYDDLHDKEGRY